jgi:hypothetical protein
MNKLHLDRRRVLAVGVGAAALGATGAAGLFAARRDAVWILEDIVRRNLPTPLIKDAAVTRFAHDFAPVFRKRYRRLERLAWLAARVRSARPDAVEALERDVLTNFLMGSDVFEPGRPQDRPIEFIAMTAIDSCNPFFRT